MKNTDFSAPLKIVGLSSEKTGDFASAFPSRRSKKRSERT